jgi:hypothetical protein
MAGTITGTVVFNSAMVLADSLDDTTDYTARALFIINMLGQELYQYSDTKDVTSGKRPLFTPIAELTDELDLDDGLAIGVLPYGLAALLLVGEDDIKADFFQQLYEEKKREARNVPQEFEPIEDVYGVI